MASAIVLAADAGADFAGWRSQPEFAALDAHPTTGGFGRHYYPAVFGERRGDATFAVVADAKPLLIVPCSIGEASLDWYGMPIRMVLASGLSGGEAEAALREAFKHIDQLIDSQKLAGASVLDVPGGPILSALGEACLNRGWVGTLALGAHCELSEGEAGLRRALRKSFRSLVNWGRKNLRLSYVNAANPDAQMFAGYRQFHLQVAGRSTRPEASWDAMFDWIAGGGGELALGHLETGELVAGTMILDGSEHASYGSGVYDRERFDKPIAHYPLYDAILRAGLRGKRSFDIGEIPQAGTVSAKEFNIGYFKRGFASEITTALNWTWRRKDGAEGEPE